MKHFNAYINEFLVNNHTKKTASSDSESIIDFVIGLADPKYIDEIGGCIYVNTRPITYTDGSARPWLYIWKYIYDNPGYTMDDVINGVQPILKKIGYPHKISANTVYNTVLDGYLGVIDFNGKCTATEPNKWNIE